MVDKLFYSLYTPTNAFTLSPSLMKVNREMPNLLFHTHDPRLIEVILHYSRYHNHIWLQHGVTAAEIQIAIETPDFINTDSDEYIENYYAQGVLADLPDAYLKVCVLFKQEQGRVLTAFAVDLPKFDEETIWSK